jgi:putative transposase
MLVDYRDSDLSIRRQCELLSLNRSSLYYKALGEPKEDGLLMRLIDEQYTKTPFYGSRKMTIWLKEKGYAINRKKVVRLMREMGLQAIYPKPRLSNSANRDIRYPYLLKGIGITRPNQVWSADITYIRLLNGHVYLVAVMDWYSRYVLSWQISNTLDNGFCLSALHKALGYGKPEIFNTDQGVQFTSGEFISSLIEKEIRISWDSRGRALDNIFVERLWRTVKYEEVYLHEYESFKSAKIGLTQYFDFYNHERFHQSLNYKTPEFVYVKGYYR